ncbi:hypothetical protein GCM10023184_23600 [Flaviaesturariibacter amylovorans]|uniref:Transmembrane protein n=1 Tax=Flaviaesturariibacter amylovorans TaxID=1084520 RepID=A0ABP8GY12_9BACT
MNAEAALEYDGKRMVVVGAILVLQLHIMIGCMHRRYRGRHKPKRFNGKKKIARRGEKEGCVLSG